MIDEGYIKFSYKWNPDSLPLEFDSKELLRYRDHLYQLGLIGYDAMEKVSFGNISHRHLRNEFIITGTQTGHIMYLSDVDLSHVISFDFESNSLVAGGNSRPSAESLTHAAIYQSRQDVNAVIHVHSNVLWQHYYNSIPATAENIEYGTPAMAYAVTGMVRMPGAPGVFLTKGHKNGIFSYGSSLVTAFRPLQELLKGVKSS